MPILNDPSKIDGWIEPDDVPRSVVVFGAAMADAGGIELDVHAHRKGQMLFVRRGALSCEIAGGLWIVPPRSALWIPGGTLHSVKLTGEIEGYNAFVDPSESASLPVACCAVSVSPLLREILARAAHLPALYEETPANSRLMGVLIDEMAAAQVEDLHLPMPADPRLRKIFDAMIAAPAERGTVAMWAQRANMSERSLLRAISRETGMSFGRWRQQLGIVLAVQWLAGGASIQQVSAGLGYESAASFVTMFRKALGTSPARYMAERYAPSSNGSF